jgi:hypothetical protein
MSFARHASPCAFEVEHLFATLGAPNTRVHTLAHVLANSFTALRTSATDLRTRGTELCVHLETRQHRIRRGSAYLSAVRHQPKVRRFHVAAALLQAVRHRHMQAHAVTIFTLLDARPNLLVRGIVSDELLFHDEFSYESSSLT